MVNVVRRHGSHRHAADGVRETSRSWIHGGVTEAHLKPVKLA